MYIRKTAKTHKGKTYNNYLLVESSQHSQRSPPENSLLPRKPWRQLPANTGWTWPTGCKPACWTTLRSSRRGETSTLRKKRRGGGGTPLLASSPTSAPAAVTVDSEQVSVEDAREAGPVQVGHQVWRQLGLDAILAAPGFPRGPAADGSDDLEPFDLSSLRTRHAGLDSAHGAGRHPARRFFDPRGRGVVSESGPAASAARTIERELAEREKTLFNLDDSLFLYDLTSTYFEGEAAANPQAKRGYSRDQASRLQASGGGLGAGPGGLSQGARGLRRQHARPGESRRRCSTPWRSGRGSGRARR